MPDPLTPEEREAREAVVACIQCSPEVYVPALNRYRDAVLAAERERIAREVEGEKREHKSYCAYDYCVCGARAANAAIDRALAVVRGIGA